MKPVIFNFDTTFTKGKETVFAMYITADEMMHERQGLPLEFKFQTNLKSELDLV